MASFHCHRVPMFPLDTDSELYQETRTKLLSQGPLSLPEVHDLFSVLTSIRRDIHAHPEPGFEEKRTQGTVKRMLNLLADIPMDAMKHYAGTGVVVDIHGSGEGEAASTVRTIALRADMDALRMTEKNTNLPYRSANEGVAHLCGHDGHMASLIGAAALIKRKAHLIPKDCTIRLLFQPAEEGPGGAVPMIKEGCMQGVDEVFGYHNWPPVPLGHMWVRPGVMMGHPSEFHIKVKGKGGHGSQPQVAVDPVVVAAHVIVALQSIVSRNVHPKEQVRTVRGRSPGTPGERETTPLFPLPPATGCRQRHHGARGRSGQRHPRRGDAGWDYPGPAPGGVRAGDATHAHARHLHVRGLWCHRRG